MIWILLLVSLTSSVCGGLKEEAGSDGWNPVLIIGVMLGGAVFVVGLIFLGDSALQCLAYLIRGANSIIQFLRRII